MTKKVFPLIEEAEVPTFPAAPSGDDIEGWYLGDFMLVMEKDPKTVMEKVYIDRGAICPEKPGIEYLYAMVAFYKPEANPYGDECKPIMAATLETSDQTGLVKLLPDGELKNKIIERGYQSEPMVCLFDGEKHMNFGLYSGSMSREAVDKTFFNLLREYSGTEDEPRKIKA